MKFSFTILCALLIASPVFAQTNDSTTEETLEEAAVTFTVSDELSINAPKHCIKANPEPCRLTIEASVENCRIARMAEITMSATSRYSQFGRQDVDQISHRWTGNECRVMLSWPITNNVMGGTYQARFTYRLSNNQTGNAQRSGDLTGENPTPQDVRARLSNLTYDVLVYLSNEFKQFNSNGMPRTANGFGVGGLNTPEAKDLWDWKHNLDTAVVSFDAAFAAAELYPERMRNSGFPNVPDFSADERKRHALQSLVGEPYYIPTRVGKGWEPMRKRLSFADDVMKIETDVAAGNPPANW
ncbi:hypothetical protein [Nereida sp. MMG025]|uniref:hypothetical protein n=1 Tax=Nereida sp. MMG025 TaxID=2909981 RepID=UPI001F337D5F|nr:hypothetical protein [Nereida sp. MMG025]MCF6445926.1 hypothetical protein [Nereida sp. MMG025]